MARNTKNTNERIHQAMRMNEKKSSGRLTLSSSGFHFMLFCMVASSVVDRSVCFKIVSSHCDIVVHLLSTTLAHSLSLCRSLTHTSVRFECNHKRREHSHRCESIPNRQQKTTAQHTEEEKKTSERMKICQ